MSLPEFSHLVERFDRDCNFGHAARVVARLQGISDDALAVTLTSTVTAIADVET